MNLTILAELTFILGAAIVGIYLAFLFFRKSSKNRPIHKRHVFEILKKSKSLIIWTEQNQKVKWKNAAFEKIAKDVPAITKGYIKAFEGKKSEAGALPLTRKDGTILWLEISKSDFGEQRLFHAIDVTEKMASKAELGRFMQTLTETFAHLPLGLAIFDVERDLSLFNPALVDILKLRPEWLARRPSLYDMLNQLHIEGLLPEPKDFKRWRDAFVELSSNQDAPHYQEDWHLPDARVLRVTARPHPGKAVALMIEDVTGPMRLELEYRHELAQMFTSLDYIDHAIVLIDSTSEICFSNVAFEDLWGDSLGVGLKPSTLQDALNHWRDNCPNENLIWDSLEVYLSSGARSETFCETIAWGEKGNVVVRAVIMPAGRRMVEFITPQSAKSFSNLRRISA